MNIVRLLRRLADNGQAIICTIHQASQEQFEQVGCSQDTKRFQPLTPVLVRPSFGSP